MTIGCSFPFSRLVLGLAVLAVLLLSAGAGASDGDGGIWNRAKSFFGYGNEAPVPSAAPASNDAKNKDEDVKAPQDMPDYPHYPYGMMGFPPQYYGDYPGMMGEEGDDKEELRRKRRMAMAAMGGRPMMRRPPPPI